MSAKVTMEHLQIFCFRFNYWKALPLLGVFLMLLETCVTSMAVGGAEGCLSCPMSPLPGELWLMRHAGLI